MEYKQMMSIFVYREHATEEGKIQYYWCMLWTQSMIAILFRIIFKFYLERSYVEITNKENWLLIMVLFDKLLYITNTLMLLERFQGTPWIKLHLIYSNKDWILWHVLKGNRNNLLLKLQYLYFDYWLFTNIIQLPP